MGYFSGLATKIFDDYCKETNDLFRKYTSETCFIIKCPDCNKVLLSIIRSGSYYGPAPICSACWPYKAYTKKVDSEIKEGGG